MKGCGIGNPHGFGSVTNLDPSFVVVVMNDKLTLDGKMVEIKHSISREHGIDEGSRDKETVYW